MCFFLLFLSFLCIFQLSSAKIVKGTNGNSVLIWTSFRDSEDQFLQIVKANLPSLTTVSVIAYELNTSGYLVCMNPDSDHSITCPYWETGDAILQKMGLSSMPTISLPPGYVGTGVTAILNSPQSEALQKQFIMVAISLAKSHNYTGYNLDWESIGDASADQFTAFVTRFADALHKENLLLSVDTTAFDYWLDLATMAKTSADLLCDMDTYTQDDYYFGVYLKQAVQVAGERRLGIGLDPTMGYSDQSVKTRFDLMLAGNISSICIWEDHIENVTDFLWQQLKVFLGN